MDEGSRLFDGLKGESSSFIEGPISENSGLINFDGLIGEGIGLVDRLIGESS